MRGLAARIVIAWLALACAHASASAQGSHALEGRVTLPNGTQPAHPVRVTLTLGGRRIHETFTDLSGRFSFNGLARGTYQLTAEGDGQTFETTSAGVELTAFGSTAQTFTQNIQLRPKAAVVGAAPAGTVSAEELDADVPAGAREKYRQGVKSAGEDKPELAVKHFEGAVAAHPRFYAASLALAEQLGKLRRYDEALAAYRRASEIKPERGEAYVGVGATLVSQKRYDEGIRMLRGVLEVDKTLAGAYLPLGYAEMMMGEHRPAETHLLRALELGRQSIAHVYLANVYEQLGEPSKAVEHLEAYLRENPQTPNAATVRGAIEKLRKKGGGRK